MKLYFYLLILFSLTLGCVSSSKSSTNLISPSAPTASVLSSNIKEQDLVWHSFDKNLFDKAKTEHKVVIVEVTLDDQFSDLLENITLKNDKVIELLNEHYLLCKVDGHSNEKDFEKLPALLFMAPDLKEFGRIEGVIYPSDFEQLLLEVNDHLNEIMYRSDNNNWTEFE